METLGGDVSHHLLSYLPNVDVCCLVLAGGTLFSDSAFFILNERLPKTKAEHPLIRPWDLFRVLMLISGCEHIQGYITNVENSARITYTSMGLDQLDRKYRAECDRQTNRVYGYRRRKRDSTRDRISDQQWTANKCVALRNKLHTKGAHYFQLLADSNRLFAIKQHLLTLCAAILEPYEKLKKAEHTCNLWKLKLEDARKALQEAEIDYQTKRRRIEGRGTVL